MPDSINTEDMVLAVIDTGGTINGVLDPDEPPPAAPLVIPFLLARAAQLRIAVDGTQLFMKDSRAVTDSDRALLAEAIKGSQHKRILIPHGTFTMAATGEYLQNALARFIEDHCIVLVGAKFPLNAPDTDAESNLEFALKGLRAGEPGIWVAMNQRLWRPEAVQKDLASGQFVARPTTPASADISS